MSTRQRKNRPTKYRGGTVLVIDLRFYNDRDYISTGWLRAAADYRPTRKDDRNDKDLRNKTKFC